MSILSESVRTTVDLESRISQCIVAFDPPTPRSSGQPSGGAMGGASASVVHSPRELRPHPAAGLSLAAHCLLSSFSHLPFLIQI